MALGWGRQLAAFAGLLLAALLLALIWQSQPALPQDGSSGAAPPAEAPPEPDTAPAIPPVAEAPASLPLSNLAAEDVPNDNGQSMALSFDWLGEPPAGSLLVEARGDDSILDEFRLSDAQKAQLDSAREKLAAELGSVVEERDAAAAEVGTKQDALSVATNTVGQTKDFAGLEKARSEYWTAQKKLDALQGSIDAALNRFAARGGRKLLEKQRKFEYLSAALAAGWVPTDGGAATAELGSRGALAQVYGLHPEAPEQPLIQVSLLKPALPAELAAQAEDFHKKYSEDLAGSMDIPFKPGHNYELRLGYVADGAEAPVYSEAVSGSPRISYFNLILSHNFLLAVIYAMIILIAVMMARRNPNLFIRRIAGLEAVDEAIGRATEMGKPVLYLTGMTDLSDLSTLAAINILGRVGRRIAAFDSELLVPSRDPVVFTVAQEVVKQGYAEQGRPDAFKPGNIYFVTDDQFSFTVSVCAIMLRERPAANFFMGYYYAESLLLAETGASTGAIQIAGTDSPNQLPFFITTCDYTLIGEELYAASAYLSREPLLLGSLKGQDLGKALMLLLILLQTILFIAQFAAAKADPTADFGWLVKWVTPL